MNKVIEYFRNIIKKPIVGVIQNPAGKEFLLVINNISSGSG